MHALWKNRIKDDALLSHVSLLHSLRLSRFILHNSRLHYSGTNSMCIEISWQLSTCPEEANLWEWTHEKPHLISNLLPKLTRTTPIIETKLLFVSCRAGLFAKITVRVHGWTWLPDCKRQQRYLASKNVEFAILFPTVWNFETNTQFVKLVFAFIEIW